MVAAGGGASALIAGACLALATAETVMTRARPRVVARVRRAGLMPGRVDESDSDMESAAMANARASRKERCEDRRHRYPCQISQRIDDSWLTVGTVHVDVTPEQRRRQRAQLCVRIGFTMAASNAAKRLMIFGGTGFVGSAIAREAAKRGLLVQCVTRGGDAPAHLKDEPWASSVTWLRGDALDPSSYKEHMRGADAVITSVGRLPFPNLSHEDIVRDNGETNVTPAKCAKEVGVDRLVVICASVPPIPGVGWGISPTSGVYAAGYAAGKAMAEAHARDEFVGAGHGGRGAAVLKPGPVSGEFIF